MRTKRTIPLLAAILLMAAFLTPTVAYAAVEGEGWHDTMDSTGSAEGGMDETVFPPVEALEISSTTGTAETTAAMDGHTMDATDAPDAPEANDAAEADIGDVLGLILALGAMEAPSESAVPDGTKPFTPEGHASVVDLAYEGDGKVFYTFQTPAGNVFYLVIDHQRNTENVYFLNAVTEMDLLALAEDAGGKGGATTSAIPASPPGEPEPPEAVGSPPTETEPPAQGGGGNTGTTIFLLIGAVAFGGAAYYVKILRPKQQATLDNDDDEGEADEGDGEEMLFEEEYDDDDGEGME